MFFPTTEKRGGLIYYEVNSRGYFNYVWIAIEQSVMVSGIVYVLMGSTVRDWS